MGSLAFDFEGRFAMRENYYATIIACIYSYGINQLPRIVKKLRFHANILPANIAVICKRSNNRVPKVAGISSLAKFRIDYTDLIAISGKLFLWPKHLANINTKNTPNRDSQQRPERYCNLRIL